MSELDILPSQGGAITQAAAESVLKKYFGHSTFRGQQWHIIESILAGRDVCVVMSTGAGKSVCYQLPPLLKNGVCMVVSPLISLMEDQVQQLEASHIKAVLLGRAQFDKAREAAARRGEYSIIYITPENLVSNIAWWKELESKLVLFAIDEAHCVYEWGHDFRKDYNQLNVIRENFPRVPIAALTATATREVREMITRSLRMVGVEEIVTSFDRPNIEYYIREAGEGTNSYAQDIVPWLMKRQDGATHEATIIYCRTKKVVGEVFEFLRSRVTERVRMYTADVPLDERADTQRQFRQDNVDIIVGTVAFGMGINKPDVRLIMHYGAPTSVEAYAQHTGRAGRDGLPARAVLFYRHRYDWTAIGGGSAAQQQKAQERIISLKGLLLNRNSCFRRRLLAYFDEVTPDRNCEKCDVCKNPSAARDFTREAWLLLNAIRKTGGKFGQNMVIDVLLGSKKDDLVQRNYHQLEVYGQGRSNGQDFWKGFFNFLAHRDTKWIQITPGSTPTSYPTYGLTQQGSQWCSQPLTPTLAHPEFMFRPPPGLSKSTEKAAARPLTNWLDVPLVLSDKDIPLQRELQARLDRILTDRARLFCVGKFEIFGLQPLRNMTLFCPTSVQLLEAVDGVKPISAQTHGAPFVEAIVAFKAEHPTYCPDVPALQPVNVVEDILPPSQPAPVALGQIVYDPADHFSARETLRLYEYGKSVQEIATQRLFAVKEIEQHLVLCVAQGYAVKVGPLHITEKHITTMLNISRNMPKPLTKQQLRRSVSNDISDLAIDLFVAALGTEDGHALLREPAPAPTPAVPTSAAATELAPAIKVKRELPPAPEYPRSNTRVLPRSFTSVTPRNKPSAVPPRRSSTFLPDPNALGVQPKATVLPITRTYPAPPAKAPPGLVRTSSDTSAAEEFLGVHSQAELDDLLADSGEDIDLPKVATTTAVVPQDDAVAAAPPLSEANVSGAFGLEDVDMGDFFDDLEDGPASDGRRSRDLGEDGLGAAEEALDVDANAGPSLSSPTRSKRAREDDDTELPPSKRRNVLVSPPPLIPIDREGEAVVAVFKRLNVTRLTAEDLARHVGVSVVEMRAMLVRLEGDMVVYSDGRVFGCHDMDSF